MNVLIFEDDPTQRIDMETRLQNQGYQTQSFSRPSLALQALEKGDILPDLALLDITLDILSEDFIQAEETLGFSRAQAGIELARRILKIKKIPIIFLTGHSGLFKEAKNIGPHAFLSKSDPNRNEQTVVNAIQLALQNFYDAPDYRPKFNLIPKGKVCLTVRPFNRNAEDNTSAFRKVVLSIDDIMYFNTQQDVTRLYVKGYERNLYPTVSASDLMKHLHELIGEKNMQDSFLNIFKGHYANINKIVSYDAEYAYFDVDSKIFCPLNKAAYHYLLTTFPPLRN